MRVRWLTVDQIREYLDAYEGMEQVLHSVLLGSALRVGEALDLRGCDVNLEADDNWGVIGDSKTGSGVRSVYIPGWVIQRLDAYLTRHAPGPDDRLFPIAKRTAQKHHRNVCDELEIDGGKPGPGADDEAADDRYRIHDHRHTAAVQLAKAGMPLNLLQRQMGHGTIGQTMRYARYHPDYTDHQPYFDRVGDRIDLEQLDGWQKPPRHSRQPRQPVSPARRTLRRAGPVRGHPPPQASSSLPRATAPLDVAAHVPPFDPRTEPRCVRSSI